MNIQDTSQAIINNTAESVKLPLLADTLTELGYGEFFACFNPLSPRLQSWTRMRSCVPGHLRASVDLFLFGEAVEAGRLPPALLDLVPMLKARGLLSETAQGFLHTPDLVLLPVQGNWLFCQRPQVNPTLYFGDDSLALLMRSIPRSGKTALDLCAGPGIQTLHAARFADHSVGVEINPVAADLARINMALNGLDHKVEILCGSLFAPLGTRRFDSVTANPPLLPFPEEIAYPFVGHGGRDGLVITKKILAGLPVHLADGGHAQIVGTTLSDGILPTTLDTLEALAEAHDLGLTMSVMSHHLLTPGSDYFDGLVATASSNTDVPPAQIAEAFANMLQEEGATHLCAFFLHAAHRAVGGLQLIDVAAVDEPGLWYIP